jgi:Transposase DDE domain
MEGELWNGLYSLLRQEAKRRKRRGRVIYSDELILLVFFWSALHDRPRCWACQSRNWPASMKWLALPSEATMSRRMRSVSVMLLLAMLYERLAALHPPALVHRADSKPLPVGGFSKDRDARRGYGAGQLVRGYKLFCIWGDGVVPDALMLGPMNLSDPAAAATLVTRIDGGGYLLGDINYDSNPLHAVTAPLGFQLVAPRKCPGTGLGHQPHEASRLRSMALLEGDSPFGRMLYAQRSSIERDFGQAGNFGGGLQPLPNWVRRPHRVVPWVLTKLLLNGLRRCQNQRLAA